MRHTTQLYKLINSYQCVRYFSFRHIRVFHQSARIALGTTILSPRCDLRYLLDFDVYQCIVYIFHPNVLDLKHIIT